MLKYAILKKPSHNRVYNQESNNLCLCELEILNIPLEQRLINIEVENICGINYFVFNHNNELTSKDIGLISKLSFLYGLFQVITQDEELLLKPILVKNDIFDESIVSVLKYKGKTNEIFTRMLVNMGYFLAKSSSDTLNLLDPVCGKGTTLFTGLSLGINAYGLDINKDSINDGAVFLKKYLEDNRYNHNYKKDKISITIDKVKNTSIKFDFAIDKSKEEKLNLNLQLIKGNTQNSDLYFKKNFFDLIIGDLPYGVQHGNVEGSVKGFTRNPKELLISSVSSWKKVLKTNGFLVLSFNENILSKNDICDIFDKDGFSIYNLNNQSSHRIDNSIIRDFIICKKN